MLHAPVLKLNVAQMHEIDPRNVENLFGMWTVFSKCADTIPDGKRLENLSWRVWARETLCCPPQPEKTIVPAIDIPLSSKEEPPSLSNSPGSVSDDDSLRTLDNSALSKSRGKEPHLTSNTLEKIISNIHISAEKEERPEPLDHQINAVISNKMSPEKSCIPAQSESPVTERSEQCPPNYSTETSCLSTMTADTRSTERGSTHRSSDTSASSNGMIRSGSVVHGFSPVPKSVLSQSNMSKQTKKPPISLKRTAPDANASNKAFTLGVSSEDECSSYEQPSFHRNYLAVNKKSSLSQSLSKKDLSAPKKTASFREVIEQHNAQTHGGPADDNAIASDDDDDDSVIDDSAIEDEDEDGWEDEQIEEERPLPNPIFQRVESRVELRSHPSMLTAGLTEGDRTQGLLNAASRSSPALKRMNRASSHTGPAVPGSPEQNEDGMMMRPSGRSILVPAPTNDQVYAMAHSPRTTRRNMLSTELTESLRKNLLWERQQKNTTVNAFLHREARSMANLPRAGQMAAQQQGQQAISQQPRLHNTFSAANHNTNNEYFNVANEYHSKGW